MHPVVSYLHGRKENKKNKPSNRLKKMGTRFSLMVAIFAMVLSSTFGVVMASTANAASTTPTDLDTQITQNLYKNALARCIQNAPLQDDANIFAKQNRIEEDNALKLQWFSGGVPNSVSVVAGPILNSDYGGSSLSASGLGTCSDPSFVKQALTALGYSTSDAGGIFKALCAVGFHHVHDTTVCGTAPTQNDTHWSRPDDNGDNSIAIFKKSTKNIPALSKAAMYILSLRTFEVVCKTSQATKLPDVALDKTTGIKVKVLTGTTKETFAMTDNFFTYGNDVLSISNSYGEGTFFSEGILSLTNPTPIIGTIGTPGLNDTGTTDTNSGIYNPGLIDIDSGSPIGNRVVIGHPIYGQIQSSNGTGDACASIGGSINQYSDDYLTWAKANEKQALQQQSASTKTTTGTTSTDTCTVDGIGWIVCPVVKFGSLLADGMFGILSNNFLAVNPSVVDNSSDGTSNATYKAWQAMQSIANVVLVIIFLVIIFSQITSFGISNYGVKKMLPRLVIAAILINLSFIFCQIAIDVSNILGYNIRDFFTGLANAAGKSALSPDGNISTGENLFSNIGGGVLIAAGVGVAGYFMLSMFGTILLAVLIALLVIVLILVGRQAIIVLAVITAPVAIALWLLPNTKKLATQWWKIFSRMLLLFPIIALIFGGSTLASVVLRDSFSTQNCGSDDNCNNEIGEILAAGIQVIPLFATPIVLKGALNAVPVLGAMASRMSSRANGKIGSAVKEGHAQSRVGITRAGRKQDARNIRRKTTAGELDAPGARGAMTRLFGRNNLALSKAERGANKALVRSAAGEVEAADKQDVGNEQHEIFKKANQATAEAMTAHSKKVNAGEFKGKKKAERKAENAARNAGVDYAQTALAQALAKNDTVKARAAFNSLVQMGQPGLVAAGDAMDASAGSIETNLSLGRHIKNNHPDMKRMDNRINQWAEGNYDALKDGSNGHLRGLTDAEIANQTVASLVAGTSVTAADATRILNDKNIQKDIKPEQRDALIAKGGKILDTDGKAIATSAQDATRILSNEKIAPNLTPQQTEVLIKAGGTPPSQSSKPEAIETIEVNGSTIAKEGTSGTSPFVVEASGVVNQNTAQARGEAVLKVQQDGGLSSNVTYQANVRGDETTFTDLPGYAVDVTDIPNTSPIIDPIVQQLDVKSSVLHGPTTTSADIAASMIADAQRSAPVPDPGPFPQPGIGYDENGKVITPSVAQPVQDTPPEPEQVAPVYTTTSSSAPTQRLFAQGIPADHSAADISSQVQAAGGFDKLDPDDVVAIFSHLQPKADPTSVELAAQALADLARRRNSQ